MTQAEKLIDTLARCGYSQDAYVVDVTGDNLALRWVRGNGPSVSELLSDAMQESLPPKRRCWPTSEFLRRFTAQERCEIIKAGKTREQIDDLYRLLLAAPEVHSDSAELLAGLAMLVQAGLLTAERRDQILGGA